MDIYTNIQISSNYGSSVIGNLLRLKVKTLLLERIAYLIMNCK